MSFRIVVSGCLVRLLLTVINFLRDGVVEVDDDTVLVSVPGCGSVWSCESSSMISPKHQFDDQVCLVPGKGYLYSWSM